MIKNVQTKEALPNHMKWWDWTEICDKCGYIIEHNNVWHSVPPQEHESHFCVECMRYFMDNHIDYDTARSLYVNKED